MKRNCSGFSLLELVVSLFIITVLIVVAFLRLERLIEDVERVSFEGTRDNIQAQITFQIADWFAVQKVVVRGEIEQLNPMDLLERKPSNYAGEVIHSALQEVSAEHWYFVTDRGWLVYKAKRIDNLENEYMQTNLIPFQVEVRLQNSSAEKGLATAATLKPLYKYYWQAD